MSGPQPPAPQTPQATKGSSGAQFAAVVAFAILLLALISVAIWQKMLPQPDVTAIVQIMVAILAAMLSFFFAGVLAVEGKVLGLAVRGTAGFAVFVLVLWLFFHTKTANGEVPTPTPSVDSVALNCSGLRPTPLAAGPLADRPIQIGLLESGNIAYVRNIAYGIRHAIETCGRAAHFAPVFEEQIGPIESGAGSDSVWGRDVAFIRQRIKPDYWVPIGTQAAVNLRRVLDSDWYKSSVVFAGVTDPVCSDLVKTLVKREGESNIGGSQYGGDPRDYLARIHDYFPQRKIVFVYDTAFPQDRCFASRIQGHPLVSQGTLSISAIGHLPTVSDLPDPNAVYFSWYSLETEFEDARDMDQMLKERIIVTTTEDNVMGKDLAALGVTGNDTDIGEKSAHALLEDLFQIQRLGDQDIEIPKYMVLMNCSTAADRHLTFPPGMEAHATQVVKC